MIRGASIHKPAERIELGGGRCVELRRLLGRGAHASVWQGELSSPYGVRRAVAVKIWSALASDDADVVVPLLARAAARTAWIRHPNVVEIYEFGISESQPFVVEELVDGVTLVDFVARHAGRRERLPLDIALFILCEIAEALASARTARGPDGVQLGVLHLGLTARDVLLSWRGEVKVSDFEQSAARGATSGVRSLSGVIGRAATMSPEVAHGEQGDARSDVFALGVLVREVLVGPRFPAGIGNHEALRLARAGHVEPVSFQPHLPGELVSLMRRALMIDPADRYPNASAIAFDLRRVAFSMGVGDGRWFLRWALDREWGNDAVEVTQEVPFQHPADDPAEHFGSRRGRRAPRIAYPADADIVALFDDE